MIEFPDKRSAFPAARVMTTLASLLELTLMNVFVASATVIETYADVLGRSIGLRKVATLALHLDMGAGERVASPRVIEALVCSFPIFAVVTLSAVGTQTSLVLVLVATGA